MIDQVFSKAINPNKILHTTASSLTTQVLLKFCKIETLTAYPRVIVACGLYAKK